MAVEPERVMRKRKHKVDRGAHRKLGVDQKVEVKSVEDGFLGSWHLGTVVSCSDLIREVEYEFIWSERGSGKLVEVVNISPIIDGVLPDDERPVHQCGMIRPSPPPCEFGSWPYGQCVDCFYQDAWWEGVLFDREEGHEERKVFFPELGDEMKAKIDKLRISQDWDEVTEVWTPRGSWTFLQVIEEIKKLNPLLVSVKQIWYEVQLKDDFDEHLKQWTSSSKDIWRKLVKEVVHDSTKLTVKHFLSELNSSQIFGEGCQSLEFSEPAFIAELNPKVYFAPFTEAACTLDSAATLPMDQDLSDLQPVEKLFVSEESASAAEDVQMTGILSSTESELPTFANSKRGRGRPRKLKKIFKGRTRVGEPDSCRGENSTKTIKEKIFEDVSPLQQPVDQDVPNLQQPLDQDISDLQPVEKQFVSEESAPATEDVLLSGILSNTKSQPLTIANSKACRGRPRTKRKIYEGQTVVGEPASCPDTTSTATFNKPPSDETAGILSSTTQTLENSKPRRGRPPKRMKTLSEPDSCPEATLIKELKKPTSHQIAGILSNGKCVNSKSRRGRLATKKKKFVRQSLSVEPDSRLKVITKCMPSMSSIKKFKKHLLWTGWKFELKREGGKVKKSYVAPNGTVCASISEVCQVLEESKICEVVPPVEQSSLHGETDNSTQSPCMERPTCREVPELHKETIAETEEISIEPGRTGIQRGDTDNSTQSPCMERPTCREVPELHKETIAETEEISIEPGRTGIQRGDTDNSTLSPCMERPTCREVPELHKETIAETEEISIEPGRTGIQRGDTDNSTLSPCMERPTCREVPELHKETIAETEEISIEPANTGIQHEEKRIELEEELEETEIPQQETGIQNEEINTEPGEPRIEPEICRQAVIDYCLPKSQDISAYQKSYRNGVKIGDTALKAKNYLVSIGWKLIPAGKNDKRIRYCSPEGKTFLSFREACKWCVKKWEAESHLPEQVSSQSAVVDKPLISLLRESRKKRKHADVKSRPSLKKGDGDMRSSKRARKVAPSSSNQIPRTVLSWLIDKNVVLPRAKVKYCEKKNGNPMAEGRITREGIKCNCCQKIFGLRNFEAHAGSICNRPSANIYLEDGRSLLECQMQMKHKHSIENKEGSHFTENDYICSVCHYGGDLILCDGCPSSFHPDCLGVKVSLSYCYIVYFFFLIFNQKANCFILHLFKQEVPDGDWFCPSCCCKVCGESRFDKNRKQFTDNTLLICCQCNHKYHAQCVRNNGLEKLDDFPVGNWLCNKSCKLICLGMRQLLKKSVIVGNDNLTWRLLKYTEPDDESSVEIYSRLCVALNVMHDSFEPVKERLTGRDIAEDVIFSRWSELNRLNFQGFYTVLLERNDELISVATVRYSRVLYSQDELPLVLFSLVYGEKVAEIPLVATQFQHRRLGMCRILFNELEKVCISSSVQFCGVEVYQRNKGGLRVYSFSCREVYDSLAADSRFLGYVFRLVTMKQSQRFHAQLSDLVQPDDRFECLIIYILINCFFFCFITHNVFSVQTLAGLGVERLVLPAVPGVLNTWTTKFGFSVVKQSERANFFDYTFLDFQGTIMCQKILEKTPAKAQQTHVDNTNSKDNVESDDNVAVSEVFQATQIEGCATVDQGHVGYVSSLFCSALKGLKKRLIRVL
ncbi:hypothetical protein MTR67_029376 [Solanum verrucosum]|uniref:PHD-type domain-containing protein n=1 Tax=Solanum verrucosum TaxID=315347 RepID=A0AAF0TX80_SOLVR|nr:hypothetical protein MTR67_029376 [Solanum verrucosum]